MSEIPTQKNKIVEEVWNFEGKSWHSLDDMKMCSTIFYRGCEMEATHGVWPWSVWFSVYSFRSDWSVLNNYVYFPCVFFTAFLLSIQYYSDIFYLCILHLYSIYFWMLAWRIALVPLITVSLVTGCYGRNHH